MNPENIQNYNTTTYCQNLVINQETIKQLMLIHTWWLAIEMSIQRSSKVQGLWLVWVVEVNLSGYNYLLI